MRSGALVAMSAVGIPQDAYQLYCDSRRIGEHHVRAVHDWLLETASAARAA